MKLCIFGAGAVGGHLAAKLAAAGNDVSVVCRGAHLQAIRARGIKLLHGSETIQGKVRASERAADLGAQDFVIVTLKASLLGAFAESCAPLLGRDTAVVFAQNGIPWWYGRDLRFLDPHQALVRAIAPERVIGGVIFSANEVVEPGVIFNHVPGRNMLVVGEADDRNSTRIQALRETLDSAGMASPATSNIRQAIWSKLVQNLGTATLCTLTGATVGEMRSDGELAKLASRLGAEGRSIAAAHGIDVDGAPERPGGGHGSGLTGHKPSMLQDFERGRPMEIDALLMAPLAFARAREVPVPLLEVVAPLIARKAAAKGLYAPGEA